MYFVYILQSQKFNRFYIGVTSDIEKRLNKHNLKGNRSTAPYKPWEIIYSESYSNKHDAYKREYYLKDPKGYLEKRKIIEDNKKHGEIA